MYTLYEKGVENDLQTGKNAEFYLQPRAIPSMVYQSC